MSQELRMLLDENAFGFLFAFYDLEDAEYGMEPADFAERFSEFRNLVLSLASEAPLGDGASALDLGHAVYFEIAAGDEASDPIAWLRRIQKDLAEHEFQVTAVLSHGSRWVTEAEPLPELSELDGACTLLHASRPSEPLRRALYAETATHGTDGSDGWGAGTYVDTEAVEALGKQLKNAPTPLACAGATFYRIGR